MLNMNPHTQRKVNWPSLVITILVIVTVAALFWAVAGEALQDLHHALDV